MYGNVISWVNGVHNIQKHWVLLSLMTIPKSYMYMWHCSVTYSFMKVYSVFKPIRRVELYLYQSTFPYYLIFQACLLYNMRCVVPLLSPLTLVSHCQISRDQSNPLLETQYCHRLLSSQKLYEISPQRL